MHMDVAGIWLLLLLLFSQKSITVLYESSYCPCIDIILLLCVYLIPLEVVHF